MNSEEHTFSLAGFLQSGFCREVQDFSGMHFILFRVMPWHGCGEYCPQNVHMAIAEDQFDGVHDIGCRNHGLRLGSIGSCISTSRQADDGFLACKGVPPSP